MEPTYLTPTYATCQALRDAGFRQPTLLSWDKAGHAVRPSWEAPGTSGSPVPGPKESGLNVSAPLLCEILPAIPAQLEIALPHPIYVTTRRKHALVMSVQQMSYVGYARVGSPQVQYRIEHRNPAEAAAQLYLLLVREGRIKGERHRTEHHVVQAVPTNAVEASPSIWAR